MCPMRRKGGGSGSWLPKAAVGGGAAVDGNDVYLNISALLSECYSVSRDEYGKSNFAAADNFEEKIKNLPTKTQEVLRRRKVAFGPLMAHGSYEKLVTMELELMDEHKNTTVASKPFPASKADSGEIMCQITECIAAHLAKKYEQAEYPKHCSPCFLVDKPGSNAKRLVVQYRKLNKLTKKIRGVYQVWNRRWKELLIAVSNPNWISAVVSRNSR